MRIRLEMYQDNHYLFTIHCNREIPADFRTDDCVALSNYLPPEQDLNPFLRDLLRMRGVTSAQVDRYAVHITFGKAFGRRTVKQLQEDTVGVLTHYLAQEGEKVRPRKRAYLSLFAPSNIDVIL